MIIIIIIIIISIIINSRNNIFQDWQHFCLQEYFYFSNFKFDCYNHFKVAWIKNRFLPYYLSKSIKFPISFSQSNIFMVVFVIFDPNCNSPLRDERAELLFRLKFLYQRARNEIFPAKSRFATLAAKILFRYVWTCFFIYPGTTTCSTPCVNKTFKTSFNIW